MNNSSAGQQARPGRPGRKIYTPMCYEPCQHIAYNIRARIIFFPRENRKIERMMVNGVDCTSLHYTTSHHLFMGGGCLNGAIRRVKLK